MKQRCGKCHQSKKVSEFSKKGKGLQSWCKACFAVYDAVYRPVYRREHRDEILAQQAVHRGSLKRQLNNHVSMLMHHHPGLSREMAEIMSAKINAENACCDICWFPETQRRRLKREGWTLRAVASRLEVDHINGDSQDHRLENLRILCRECNTYRGANEYSDHETLCHAHWYWYNKSLLGHNFIRSWIKPMAYVKGGIDEVPIHI